MDLGQLRFRRKIYFAMQLGSILGSVYVIYTDTPSKKWVPPVIFSLFLTNIFSYVKILQYNNKIGKKFL